jgi:tRNA(fMet)-specific endonuclease VapC
MGNIAGPRYLPDTSILSALIRQPQVLVASTLARRGYTTVCTSVVVAAELRFSARKHGSRTLTAKVDDLGPRCQSWPSMPGRIGFKRKLDSSWSKPVRPLDPTTC